MSHTYRMRVYVYSGQPDVESVRNADLAICDGVIVKDRHFPLARPAPKVPRHVVIRSEVSYGLIYVFSGEPEADLLAVADLAIGDGEIVKDRHLASYVVVQSEAE